MLANLVKLNKVSNRLDFSHRFFFFTYNFDGHLFFALLVLALYDDIAGTSPRNYRTIDFLLLLLSMVRTQAILIVYMDKFVRLPVCCKLG